MDIEPTVGVTDSEEEGQGPVEAEITGPIV
jgi:hypothetical protein